MLVFSLDEQGDFEYLENDDKIVLIAGVLFEDKGIKDEIAFEEKRIAAYYRAVCKECSTEEIVLEYPESLHAKGNDTVSVGMLKRGVRLTIKEFLESGTFEGKDLLTEDGEKLPKRKGIYYPYAYIKSDNGKYQFSNSENCLMNEKNASNLYYYMVKDAITRVICQFPRKYDDNTVDMHIATRSTPIFPLSDKTRVIKYEKAGYKLIKEGSDNRKLYIKDVNGVDEEAFRVQLTNQDVYRTALREVLLQNNRDSVNIQMDIQSISYKKKSRTSPFLYMADTICSLISYNLKGRTGDERFTEVIERAKDISNPNKFLLYGYDPVDDYFSVAYNDMLKGDLYSVYYNLYEGQLEQNTFSKYYVKKWFRVLEREIERNLSNGDIELALMKIEHSQLSNSYEISVSEFIIDRLILLCEKNSRKKENVSGKVLFKLYSVAITAYSHIGAPDKAKQSYSKALRYSYHSSAEDYLKLKMKMVDILSDGFEYKEAMKLAEQNLIMQEKISDLKNTIIEILPPEMYLERNKALSQMGQVYAFQRNIAAEKMFKEAMINMKSKTPNYYITESYLLHFYIDNGMKEKYEKRACEYFGNRNDLEGQFDYIVQQSTLNVRVISVSFALYVYLKALWFFYKDDIPSGLLGKLVKIQDYLCDGQKRKYRFSAHPNELVLKYLIYIMIYTNQHDSYDYYNKYYDDSFYNQGDLVQCIGLYGKMQIRKMVDENSRFPEMPFLISKMVRMLGENLKVPETFEEQWNMFTSMFTFMYV